MARRFEHKNKYTLYINPYNLESAAQTESQSEAAQPNEVSNELYNHYIALENNCLSTEDSGVDLYVPLNQTFHNNKVGTINHQIRCFMKENATGLTCGYYMYPRSSIYKYPLMAANSVGIIDAGYRGNIMAKVRCFENDTYIAMGSKLFQICAPDLSPLNVKVITSPEDYSMEASQIGRNGFGSSGR